MWAWPLQIQRVGYPVVAETPAIFSWRPLTVKELNMKAQIALKTLFFSGALFVTAMATMVPSRAFADEKSRADFLSRLGFNDVPSVIQKKLDQKNYITELNRRQMEANISAYQVLNASRELSILVFSELEKKSPVSSHPNKKFLAQFVAQMLNLKPQSPEMDYPESVLKIENEEARHVALVEWIREHRVVQMNQQKNKILSDLVQLIWDGKLEGGLENRLEVKNTIVKMDGYLKSIVETTYMDDTIGNSKFFGRAMLALVKREEVLQTSPESKALTEMIAKNLRQQDQYIENFIGDKMIIATKAGPKEKKIQNGTMMLTRYLAPGSLEISIAAIPGTIYGQWKARVEGLIGNPIAAPFYVGAEDAADGIDALTRLNNKISQAGLLREGYSHIVYYQVKVDPETGIKMPRVIDNYPNRVFDTTGKYVRTGGTRFSYAEQVVDLSHHSAVYFMDPIPEKLKEWSQESVKEFGYQKEFFPSVELQLNGVTPIKNNKVVYWKSEITEEEFKKIHAETDAQKLSDNIWYRFTEGLEKSVYESWIFHWPDPYYFYIPGATYCSQLAEIVMQREVGISIEKHKSEWHSLIHIVASFGQVAESLKPTPLSGVGDVLNKVPASEKGYNLSKLPIIAPISIAVQPFMTGGRYLFKNRTLEERFQSPYAVQSYAESNADLTAAIVSQVSLHKFSTTVENYVLDYGAALRDFEFGVVMRASKGIKTIGISEDSIAEIGSRKEAERLNISPSH